MTKPNFLLPGEKIEKKGIPMAIYGEPGAGKTSLIKTLLGWTYKGGWDSNEPYCKPEELLVIDVESGTNVLERDGKYPCTIFPVNQEELDDVKKMKTYLKEEKHPYTVVVFDNVTELERYTTFRLGEKRYGKEAIPEIKQWGEASNYLRKWLREFRDLKDLGIDVIFMYWDQRQKQGSKDNPDYITCPMVMADTWIEYMGLMEHYAYLGITQQDSTNGRFKKGDRFLQFESSGMIKAKKRDERIEKFELANLADIYRKLRS